MPGPQDASQVPPPLLWSDALRLDSLEVIAQGVTEFSGFDIARIALVRQDELEVVAVSGDPASVAAALGVRTTIGNLLTLVSQAQDWGILRFVPEGPLTQLAAPFRAIPAGHNAPPDDDKPWRPLDVLLAPLYDRHGELRAILSFDRPRDGRRPGPARRRILERCAIQALRAILNELEYDELAQRTRMAEIARRVVRTATAQTSLSDIVADCRTALQSGYAAREAWVHVFDENLLEEPSTVLVGARDSTDEVARVTRLLAVTAWESQQVIRLTVDQALGTELDPTDQEVTRRFLDERRIGSLMVVPLGAAEQCLGALMLSRGRHDPGWSDVEASTALDLGHDLGRAVLNLRTLNQQDRLVARLQSIDAYKDQLISTISHELRTPLTSILGNLEFLDVEDLTADEATAALAAADRGAKRLVTIVEDLLLLSRVSDPDPGSPFEPVDIRSVALAVRDLTAVTAQKSGQSVEVILPEGPVRALGETRQLDRALGNLVTNALKYSPPDSTVTLTVEPVDREIRISCSDSGIGISPEDQENLFREFFRSADPEARSRGGSGLGLAIVDRIVTRHRGRIEVESTLGGGSTFTLHLPAV
ncbi:hypothetical protein GCM10027020_30180 [Nocardioides salsibiostraticola]